jgi:hypothetical protein
MQSSFYRNAGVDDLGAQRGNLRASDFYRFGAQGKNMAAFLSKTCSYAEITSTTMTKCQRLTSGAEFCAQHQLAGEQLNWLEQHVADAELPDAQ